MNDELLARIRRHACMALDPVPTGLPSRLSPIGPIHAVLFDVYGTLLVSGSGDIGVGATAEDRAAAMRGALHAVCGAETTVTEQSARHLVERFLREISDCHERQRSEGIEYPEVDVMQLWRAVVPASEAPSVANFCWDDRHLCLLAIEYELRVNPVWPMPAAVSTLRQLRSAGLRVGIISNAQFFTPLMWQATAEVTFEEAGVDPALQYFSYRFGQAKPGVFLYEQAASQLRKEGVESQHVLYVGNDLRNDVAPAAHVGFRTALFAGDKRSLRLRTEDPTVADVQPDWIVDSLDQLGSALVSQNPSGHEK